MTLAALWTEARRQGWSSGLMSLGQVQGEATALGWTPMPTREGDDVVSVLRPAAQKEAHPRSISAVHGLGEQPLHVDGAHLRRPPDIVVLTSSAVSSTPTLVWKFRADAGNLTAETFDALHSGLFIVGAGPFAFLAPAMEVGKTGHELRFDPTVMTPGDDRALTAADYLSRGRADAMEFHWGQPDQALVLDNRRALHARAEMTVDDDERKLTRIAFHLPEEE